TILIHTNFLYMIFLIATTVIFSGVVVAQPAVPNFVDVAPYCASINESELCLSEFACNFDMKQFICVGDPVATARLNDAACYPKNEVICKTDPRCFFRGSYVSRCG
ncbi:hypothetical protein SARC_06712, partial [Sphaeroforma arctica JP610]